MNLSTYFLCYYLFSSAMITLLDRFYITRKRSRTHTILWVIFSFLSGVTLFLLPGGAVQKVALLALAAWLVVYGLVLAGRVIIAYRRAVRIFDDTYADDIGAYIEWLSIFTYWALIFGVGCGLLTFLPDEYVFIWILSSIPFYIYLFCSYQNYLMFYEQVENAFEQDIQSEEEPQRDTETDTEAVSEQEIPVSYTEITEKINNWIKTDGYIRQGLTIKELSEILHTNRTYLSAYIKTTYKMTFREWITGLRLEYAKNMLKEHPEINVQKLAESSGFLSRSNFIKSFTEKEGCTPAKWRKANLE
jgi:AraC-like DNA-binding protein